MLLCTPLVPPVVVDEDSLVADDVDTLRDDPVLVEDTDPVETVVVDGRDWLEDEDPEAVVRDEEPEMVVVVDDPLVEEEEVLVHSTATENLTQLM